MSVRGDSLAGVAESGERRWRWREYYALTKPRVVMLLVFTAVVGMWLARPGEIPWNALLFGTLGITLAAAGAAALNHLADRRADAVMRRTRRRPLPSGGLGSLEAGVFAVALSAVGLAILYWLVNPLTAALTFASLIGYACIYTLYLKRATPQNIVIGGAAGAAPPVLGWTAVTGAVEPHALLLFLIIFVWTPPHFWALAVAKRDDYARAEIPMLPVTHGDRFARLQVLLYTVLLLAVSLLPYATFMSGPLYALGALALGAAYLYYNVAMLVSADRRWPMRSFNFSIVYLFGLFAVMFADRYLPWALAALST